MYPHLWLPVVFALLPMVASAAPAVTDIAGQYRSAGTGMVVTIGACDGGRMCGRIVALGALPATDSNNPTPALQARPLCGLPVLDGLEWQNGSWRGSLYEPQNGTNYTVSMTPENGGAVRVSGHSGRAVLSRTMIRPFEVWELVATPITPCGGALATS
jgi:uncharacterized protein (DUF2147 family)